MGKTSLAMYWLEKDFIKKKKKPEGIFWWSFYDIDSGFEIFINTALRYVSKDKIDPNKIESLRERMDRLYQILRHNKYLLVLDGIERLLRYYSIKSSKIWKISGNKLTVVHGAVCGARPALLTAARRMCVMTRGAPTQSQIEC